MGIGGLPDLLSQAEHQRDVWRSQAEAAEALLLWYRDHKTDDGSYDGEMWGDLNSLSTTVVALRRTPTVVGTDPSPTEGMDTSAS